jgi:hypothetical protein
MIVLEQTILLELELKQLYKYTQIYIEILYLNDNRHVYFEINLVSKSTFYVLLWRASGNWFRNIACLNIDW